MLRLGIAWWVVLASAAAAPMARAQVFPTDEFSAMSYRPSPSTHRYLTMEGAEVGGTTTPPIDLSVDYAYRPLYIKTFCEDPEVGIDCDVNQDRVAIVEHLAALHLGAAYALGDRVELALSVPFLYASGDGFAYQDRFGNPTAVLGGSAGGVGDPRLSVQARLLGTGEEGFVLSAVAWGTAPLGQATMEGRYVGDDSLNVGGHVVAEVHQEDARVAIMLGGLYRPSRGLIGVDTGSMMSFGAAGEYRLSKITALIGEVAGATGFGGTRNLIEGRGAARLRAGPLEITAGLGVGLVRGPGAPWFRLLAGVRWAPLPERDLDGDGIADDVDACPDVAEDLDGYADEDGCPEADNDGDGIPDEEDRCPDEAEDVDDHEDEDGCPDLDNDGDGVPDGYDSCPSVPEDIDGDRDDDGCPDLDRDRDGVEDGVDRCPDEPEDTDGLADDDGCPETDADGDGIPDEDDECPEVPGTECPPPAEEPPTTPERPSAPGGGPDAGRTQPGRDGSIDWSPP